MRFRIKADTYETPAYILYNRYCVNIRRPTVHKT